MKEYDLFISYSSKDRDFVSQLAKDMKARGIKIWLDLWEIKPGDRLRDRINDAIPRCNYFVVVFSPNSINSSWVKLELDSASIRELESKEVVVIPALFGHIADTEIPQDLKGKKYLDFRDRKKYAGNLEDIAKLFEPNIGENQKSLRKLAKKDMEFIFKPWRILWSEEEKPELFAYKSPNRFDGVCRIERINLPDGRIVIMCEEVNENPGKSITNCIEYLALQVCEQYDIDPKQLVLLTHHDTWYSADNEWMLVNFARIPPENSFQEPSWQEMTEADWRSLGFRPRKRRVKNRPVSGVIWYRRKPDYE